MHISKQHILFSRGVEIIGKIYRWCATLGNYAKPINDYTANYSIYEIEHGSGYQC